MKRFIMRPFDHPLLRHNGGDNGGGGGKVATAILMTIQSLEGNGKKSLLCNDTLYKQFGPS